jgi:2-hydroxychromene-2-carboxylate isomerase
LFYQNFWVHYAEPTKPENLLAIVSTIVGGEEEAKKVLETSKGDETKKRLSGNTDRAFGEGAFGLPWFVGTCLRKEEMAKDLSANDEIVTNSKGETESFWGIDHLGQLCDHLGLERPGERGWRALL